jgi:hypothetical protein
LNSSKGFLTGIGQPSIEICGYTVLKLMFFLFYSFFAKWTPKLKLLNFHGPPKKLNPVLFSDESVFAT